MFVSSLLQQINRPQLPVPAVTHVLLIKCSVFTPAGLFQMLAILLPTYTGYYKGDTTVKDKKAAHDKAAAAVAQQQRKEVPAVTQGQKS